MIEFASWAEEGESQARIHQCDGAAARFVNDIYAISQRNAAPTQLFLAHWERPMISGFQSRTPVAHWHEMENCSIR